MSNSIKVIHEGQQLEIAAGSTGFELFTSKTIVASRVNGELKDLAHKFAEGDVVEGVEIVVGAARHGAEDVNIHANR